MITRMWRKRRTNILIAGAIFIFFYFYIFTSAVFVDPSVRNEHESLRISKRKPEDINADVAPKKIHAPPKSRNAHQNEDLLEKFNSKNDLTNFSLQAFDFNRSEDFNKKNQRANIEQNIRPNTKHPRHENVVHRKAPFNAHMNQGDLANNVDQPQNNSYAYKYKDDHQQDEPGIHNLNKNLKISHINRINNHSNVYSRDGLGILKANLSNSSGNIVSEKSWTRFNENLVEDEDCFEVSKHKKYDGVKLPEFVDYARPGDPGEHGKPFHFNRGDLTIEKEQKKKADFNIHYFDVWVSKKIAVHRWLPDNRRTMCKEKNFALLPAVSVLIVFYNEEWTTLLRTIHSILDRSPNHLLKEIVLLDDFSNMDHLKGPLEAYVQPFTNIRLLRAKKRLGLIRARNLIFEHSSGDVVVFLDSHVECFPGWLEPLLEPIQKDNKTVTFPTIEYLNPYTFGVGMSQKPTLVGGLILEHLSFNWLYSRPFRGNNNVDYIPSPTMPGGLYAISRSYFRHLGKYDPGMDVWGSENVEASFKIWMCGGSILLVTCSHVGHIYRKSNPAFKSSLHIAYKNAVRVAEVWMDQYKHFFYEKLFYRLPDFGDVSSRVELRKSLQCQNFSWYLEHVYPELRTIIDENAIYFGQIRNPLTNLCLERQLQSPAALAGCQFANIRQFWHLNTDGSIIFDDKVIGLETKGNVTNPRPLGVFSIEQQNRFEKALWDYDHKQRFVNRKTGQCLSASKSKKIVSLDSCSSSLSQIWIMTTRKQLQQVYKRNGVNIDWTV